MSKEAIIEDIKTIHDKLRKWCYAKRNENEREDHHVPLFTCMDEAIISVLAEMEMRLRKLEHIVNKQNSTDEQAGLA